jgi:hypothetical protein
MTSLDIPTYEYLAYIEPLDIEVEVEVTFYHQPLQRGDWYTEYIPESVEAETYSCIDPRVTPEMLEECIDRQDLELEILEWIQDKRRE